MKAYIAAASIFSLIFMATPALPEAQQSLCQSFSGQFLSVTGKIDSASIEDGVAKYVVDQADLPCITAAFYVDDPGGQLRCHEGERITASGIVTATDLQASISTANYSCQ